MANPFVETKNLIRSYIEYTSPLSFEQWAAIADDQKAAVLYLQFFDQITLAWYKADSMCRGCAEDGVSTVLQYLQKNVPIILAAPKKFTPSYVYRVAYNCLYCICHDIKRDKERFEHECSNIVITAHSEINLYDLVPFMDEALEVSHAKIQIWAEIEDMGPKAQAVVSKLIGEEAPGARVSASEKAAIIAELKRRLSKYQDAFDR